MSTENLSHNVEKRYDLHSHTTCSDGQFSVAELIDRAVNFQINVLAITDHDTVAAIDIAKKHILEKNYPIELLSGVEISTSWHGFDIHIVGLNINHQHAAITELLDKQQACRIERAKKIAEKLAKAGFIDIYQQTVAMAGTPCLTRAHFAKTLYHQGVVSKMQQAFDKYLAKGKRAFVKPQWCDMATAIKAIHLSGGVAVLAHPTRYDLSGKWRRKLIVEFKHAGGDGLEVALPQMSKEQKQLMQSYCIDYNLLASAGSDFHYPTPWSDLGRNLTFAPELTPIWHHWQQTDLSVAVN